MTPLQNLLDNAILAKGMAILNRARAEPIWARKIRKVCKEFALLGAFKVELQMRRPLYLAFGKSSLQKFFAYDTISLAARILPNGPKPRESKSRLVTPRGRRIQIISPCLCCAVLCCAPKVAVCGHPKIFSKFSLEVLTSDLLRGSFPNFRKNEA